MQCAILPDDTLTTPLYRKSGYQLNYQSQGRDNTECTGCLCKRWIQRVPHNRCSGRRGTDRPDELLQRRASDHSLRPYRRTGGFAGALYRAP